VRPAAGARAALALLCALAVGPAAGGEARQVLLIGDSITFGGVSAPKGPPFAELLARDLGPGYGVVNVGCAGSCALHWVPDPPVQVVCLGRGAERLALFDALARPHAGAAVAVVLLGTNDSAFGIGALEYRRDLGALVQGLLGIGVARVLLLTPPPSGSADPAARARFEQYRSVIAHPSLGLCRAGGRVACGPDLAALLDPERDFAAGDAHPNASGHARIARALAEAIRAPTG
jgi:lysophospholipase L1-like esterase